MANASPTQPYALGNSDDSNVTQPLRKRDKLRCFLGLSKDKSKGLKNKTSNQSLDAQAPLQAASYPPVVFQPSQKPSDDNQSDIIATPVDKPLSTPPPSEIKSFVDIFPKNVAKPVIKTVLPNIQERIEATMQLVYCNKLIFDGQSLELGVKGSLEQEFDEAEHAWIETVGQNPIQQEHLRWLVVKVVEEFVKIDVKTPILVAEVVILGPILDRDTYRSLLSCFITKFERDVILDIAILQGLVQLIESASSGYLEDDDLVRTLAVLRRRLEGTHGPSSEHMCQIAFAVARLLDVMVNTMVKDVNRTNDHQPLVAILMELKDNTDPILQFQAEYSLQAAQYIPDDESTLQAVLRFGGGITVAALGVASICKLDPSNFFSSLDTLRQAAGQAFEVTKSILEGMEASQKARFGAMQSLVHGIRKGTKHEWYLTLLAAKTFVREGRLAEFRQTVCEAYCRDERAFQLGVCQILGEIAMDPLWDLATRQNAVDFLGSLFRAITTWKQHAEVKQWILIILTQLSGPQDAAVKDLAANVIQCLIQEGAATTSTKATATSYLLKIRLPLPDSSLLLNRVQNIPYLEYDLHKFRLQRLEDSRQRLYIPLMAKANLQARNDDLFPLMDKVQEFLAGDREVMLVLGDSGAGKSTFNKHLEHQLWTIYSKGDRIPLHINIPAIERPDQDMVTKQLQMYNFNDDQIREMKEHRQFILICDGYDESQLTTNLHKLNRLNQQGQWQAKMIASCRTQFLGPVYLDRFVPQGENHYQRPALDRFQEAVIAPFSKQQIEDYVGRYVPLEPRSWVSEDYMRMLTTIPNLMDLVKNPFLLSLSLEALPSVTKGQWDISNIKITRVQLYDYFVDEWLGANMRRLLSSALTKEDRVVMNELVDEGFLHLGADYSARLALAIFHEQDGNPIVQYTLRQDKNSWKTAFFGADPAVKLLREASPMSRTGNQHRFVHRSVLEYFFSRVIYNPVKIDEEFDPHAETAPCASPLLDANNPLFQRALLKEPSVIQFLSDRVKLSQDFERQLRGIVILSKTDISATIAATNAITILVRAGMSFIGADLRGVKVPGADLSNGQFDSAQFQGADLTGVNLSKTWLRQVDMTDAHMEGVRFGELPYLEVDRPMHSCTYSPDGKMLGVALRDGLIYVYDTSTWTRLHYLEGHVDTVRSTAFSPDSKKLVSGSDDKTLRLWDSTSGEELFVMRGHSEDISSVAYSPCGNRIASAGGDKTVRLWDAQTGESLFVLEGHESWIKSVKYSPDGRQVVSGSSDGTIRFWNPETGEPGLVWSPYLGDVRSLSYSPNGRWIATGHWGGHLQLWDSVSGQPGPVLSGHIDEVTGIDFSRDGQLIASSSDDQTVRLWNASTGALVAVLTGHNVYVSCVAFSPNGCQIVSGGYDCKVRLWEVGSSWSSLDLRDGGCVEGLAYSCDGGSLLSYDREGIFRQWDSATGSSAPISLEIPEQRMVTSAAYTLDGSQLAIGCEDGSIRLWNRQTSTAGPILEGHSSQILKLVYSPCGRWIVSTDWSNTVRLWDLHDVEQQHLLVDDDMELEIVNAVVFTSTGGQFAIGDLRGSLYLFDTQSRECQSQIKLERGILSLAYSPNDQQIAIGTENGRIYLWDLQLKEPGTILEGHEDWVQCIAYSPCGQWIASGSDDKTVGIWHRQLLSGVESWSRVHSIRAFFRQIGNVAWNPVDPMELVTGTLGGSVQVWRMSIDGDGKIVIKMVWGPNLGTLCTEGATFTNAVGLSPTHQQLLLQRGALPFSKEPTFPHD